MPVFLFVITPGTLPYLFQAMFVLDNGIVPLILRLIQTALSGVPPVKSSEKESSSHSKKDGKDSSKDGGKTDKHSTKETKEKTKEKTPAIGEIITMCSKKVWSSGFVHIHLYTNAQCLCMYAHTLTQCHILRTCQHTQSPTKKCVQL